MRRTTSGFVLFSTCLGILLSAWLCPSPKASLLTLLILSICYALLYCFPTKHPTSFTFPLVALIGFMSFGFCSMSLHQAEHYQAKHLIQEGYHDCNASIMASVQKKSSYYQVKVALESVDGKEIHKSIHLLLNSKDSTLLTLKPGDKLRGNWRLNSIAGSSNPHNFDYSNYLDKQSIFFQCWLSNSDWIKQESATPIGLKALAQKVKISCLKIIEQHISLADHQSVIKAMVLGDKSSMTKETKSIFSETGSIHVMAVSGLHVGVIYLFLLALMRLLSFCGFKNPWVKNILIVLCIWFYATLSGFAPSVIRASLMLTLFISAKLINKPSNIYQILMVAATCILAIDPSQVFELSFQFSFLALTGIVYFKPIIDKYLWSSNKFVQSAISLVNVSLAAQVFILPLMLYHFHQFPVFFVVSSLLAIPLASIIIWLSLLGMLTGFIPILQLISAFIFKSLDVIIGFLLGSMSWLQSIPGHLIKGIYINQVEFLGMYGLIISYMLWRETQNKKWLLVSMLLPCVCLVLSSIFIQQEHKVNRLFIYHTYHSSLIEFQSLNKAYLINPDHLSEERIDQIRENNSLANYLQTDYQTIDLADVSADSISRNARIKIINTEDDLSIESELEFSTILIRHEVISELEKLPVLWQNADLVFDGTNAKLFINTIQSKYSDYKIYNTYQQAYTNFQP